MTKQLSDEELGRINHTSAAIITGCTETWGDANKRKWISGALAVKAVVLAEQKPAVDAEELAILFHDTYERLAPRYGYETRQDTRTFDKSSLNGRLMLAVSKEILARFPQASQTAVAVPEARFFFDHGLWHDRVTGQHMYTQDQYDQLRRDALNTGWVIENGKQGDALRYRTWQDGVPVWTADPNEATRYSRRVDAENVHREDEDAWRIVEHVWHDLPTNSADESAPRHLGSSATPNGLGDDPDRPGSTANEGSTPLGGATTGEYAKPTYEELLAQVNWVRDALAIHGYDGPLYEACCPLKEWLNPSAPQAEAVPVAVGEIQEELSLEDMSGAHYAKLFVHLPVGTKLYTAPPQRAEVEAQYNELLFAVAQKFPGESRHETALRYIRERESSSVATAAAKRSGDPT